MDNFQQDKQRLSYKCELGKGADEKRLCDTREIKVMKIILQDKLCDLS